MVIHLVQIFLDVHAGLLLPLRDQTSLIDTCVHLHRIRLLLDAISLDMLNMILKELSLMLFVLLLRHLFHFPFVLRRFAF